MKGFQIACQTITWGPGQKECFPEVFSGVARAGFTGVEIGFRHIRGIAPNELSAMLQDAGLKLVASHVGGNLLDPDQANSERAVLDGVLAYLASTGTGLLMYSGLRYTDDAQLERDIDILNKAAERSKEHGMKLLYHNHSFEFENDGKVIRALLNNKSSDLGFCPDIGWVMKGGMDITKFLNAAGDRIGAIHFKDFATTGRGCDTVVLGDGVAPLKEAADWLQKNANGMWVIAEQDHADVPAPQAAARNAAFLKAVF